MKKSKQAKSTAERQKKLRQARKKWLKDNGFNSPEGLVGCLVRGEYVISKVKK